MICLIKKKVKNLLDLLGIFVADKDNDWINVNTVEPFDGVRGNVKQTVTTLNSKHTKKRKQQITMRYT